MLIRHFCFALPLCALLLGSTGCFRWQDCTTEYRKSLVVTVTDEIGELIADATVTFSVDGNAFEPCIVNEDATYTCGFETSGHFTVRVDLPGYQIFETSQHISEDECHVITETLEVELVPLT
ncbi:MAG: carboxypeptidase regulatory-like domain-containing protein [Polyangiaceae bacterium]|nr:carboxypeptidase regulatory-like domain-containing protein [Polyangiaceae bacterium]